MADNAPSIAVARTASGVQTASNLLDVRLQLLLLTEASEAILRKLVEQHPLEQPSRLVVPSNGGVHAPHA